MWYKTYSFESNFWDVHSNVFWRKRGSLASTSRQFPAEMVINESSPSSVIVLFVVQDFEYFL